MELFTSPTLLSEPRPKVALRRSRGASKEDFDSPTLRVLGDIEVEDILRGLSTKGEISIQPNEPTTRVPSLPTWAL